MGNIYFPNGRMKFFFIFQIVKFYKIVNYSKVNYLGNWLIFQIRNFWNFRNWKFLGETQNIKWSNVERPGFRNFIITNIKITIDELFHFFIFEFFFLNEILKFKKFVFFFNFENDKLSEIQQFRKFCNFEKLSNTSWVQVIFKNTNKK